MAVEAFDFSGVLTLSDGTVAEVQQTDIQRDERQGMTFFVTIRPHAAGRKSFTGGLHFSGPSLTNLNECAGDTRAEKSQHVVDAMQAWVRRHDLEPHFVLEIAVGIANGDPCHVSVSVGST